MTEYTANIAIVNTVERSGVREGATFRKPGPVRTYRKPSLLVRILRAIGL